jgi:2-oxo-3-hexenedioate decarboxylase
MSIGAATIDALAERLENAELNRTAITKITDDYPELTFEDAYDIQFAIRARKEARGTRIAGLKMGLTSQAKMKQMNVENPLYGFLTDYGALPDGAEISVSNYIHPRIEAEIAIVTNRELKGPGCHIGQVLAATETVLPAVEVLDSRFIDFKFDLPSVVADNTSAASFVTGGRARRVDEVDMPTLGVVLSKNGAIVEVGAGAAGRGHPAESFPNAVYRFRRVHSS